MANHIIRYKIGRIPMNVAKQAHIKCANIYVENTYLTHIDKKHKTELQQLNITAFDYLKLIIDNYDQIRERPYNAVMLVKTNTLTPHNTCIIELIYDNNKNLWLVRTSQPRRDIEDSKLIWKK